VEVVDAEPWVRSRPESVEGEARLDELDARRLSADQTEGRVRVAERTDLDRIGGGVRLTREVLGTLPPLDRGDEAVKATVEGLLAAAELLEEDDIGTTEA
jgi:hypothetical protein